MNTHVVPRIDFIDVARLAIGMRLELDWIVPGARHARGIQATKTSARAA
jgi:hypothetical protein